jgi:predicted kinase
MIDYVYWPLAINRSMQPIQDMEAIEQSFTSDALDAQDRLERLLNEGYQVVVSSTYATPSETNLLIILFKPDVGALPAKPEGN